MQPLLAGGAVAFDSQFSRERPAYLTELLETTSVSPAEEVRALWVVRDALTSLSSIDRLIDFAISTRFHLLFVQVRGRGDAYYVSKLAAEPPDLEFPTAEFDPLEYLLIRAHQAGISVHAWLNVFYVWSNGDKEPPPGHVAADHPEWLLQDATGTSMGDRSPKWWQASGVEGYYLSPTEPAVRAHMRSVVRELIDNYDIDGIHLDYIRYPGIAFGFDVTERTRLMLRWGIDPAELARSAEDLRGILGRDFYDAVDSLYTGMRSAAVDSMVMAIRRESRPLPLSAAVVTDPERGRIEKGQDWVRWVYQDMVDFVVPMAYVYSPLDIQHWIRVLHNTVGRDRVLPGLAIHGGRDRYLAESIALLRELPAMGMSIFSYNVLAEKRFAARFINEAFFAPAEEQE